MAESVGRLTPFKLDTPKSLEKNSFLACSDSYCFPEPDADNADVGRYRYTKKLTLGLANRAFSVFLPLSRDVAERFAEFASVAGVISSGAVPLLTDRISQERR